MKTRQKKKKKRKKMQTAERKGGKAGLIKSGLEGRKKRGNLKRERWEGN